jgi:hypothetical protein
MTAAAAPETSDMEPADQDGRGVHVTLWAACRAVRRSIALTAWAVFEDVVMDSTLAGDRLIAATSARRVAEHLGVTPATAANALRRLRHHGLLEHERLTGPSGRFGLSVYRINLVDGIALTPCVDEPSMASPRAEDRQQAHATIGHAGTVEQTTRPRGRGGETQQLTFTTDLEVGGD